MSIGFATNERSRLFTHTVSYSHDDYEAQSFLNLLAPLGLKLQFDHQSAFLTVPENVNHVFSKLTAGYEPPFAAIFPGASIRERRWSVEKFRDLANRFTEYGFTPLLVGGRNDFRLAEEIAEGSAAVNLAGKTSLSATAAVIKNSRLLVSGDSGVLHLGVGLGVPSIALFGPGIAAKWAPRGFIHRVIDKKVPCSPCTLFGTTPACPDDVSCLEQISIDEVFTAVVSILERSL
jgi:ADP-heptose:LPS heptosyltransferase